MVARRILSRYGWAKGNEPYESLSAAVADALGLEAVLDEFHALLVEHGKRHCRTTLRCLGCPLVVQCKAAPGCAELGAGP